ncbi:site-specific integrase [Solimicrobium silvestre]|uniref:Phage integrase family n=1 Tax=Solimicrobium silvestre TaxID=2099400 RepID=A0A2S9GYC8_9BURK|nr:site-specific integrase [Solimicrobium silvestre]PRC92724.1 Phage integrase family [Solimicrobium silvestre]
MPTIRKRGEYQWEVQVRRKGYPPQSKTFTSRADAELWGATVESEIGRGVFIDRSDAERHTVGDAIDRFKSEFAPFHYKARDDKKEAWRFQCEHLKRDLGKYSLAALDPKMVAHYRDKRLATVGESTVRKELFMLSKILKFVEMECGITLPRGNPVGKIRKPSERKHRDRRLTDDEWLRLNLECKRSQNKFLCPAMEFALETGMRQGELLALSWQDLDRKRSIVLLKDTKNGEERAVPLSPDALKVLDNLIVSIRGKIFPLQRVTLFGAFKAACVRAEVKDFKWHDLRHEGLSRLAERGDLNVLEIAAVSGHKTLSMLKRYTHLQAEKLAVKLAATASRSH